MTKFFVILFCFSAGCFVWTEASPFFFNIQKSYVSQPTQAQSRTTVSQNVDFGLGGIVSKWLALSQIFTDKLVGKTQQRPRPTQRPVVQIDPVYVPEKLILTTSESPAEEIGTSTRKETTDRITTTDGYAVPDSYTTTERSGTPDEHTTIDKFTTTERRTTSDEFTTTHRTSTSSYSTDGTSSKKPSTDDIDKDGSDTDTDGSDTDSDGSDTDGEIAFTTDRTTSTHGYDYTKLSTTSRTTHHPTSDLTTDGYEYTTPSTTSRTTFYPTDRTTNGYDYTTPSTTSRTTYYPTDRTTNGYEYTTPSTPYTITDRPTVPHGYVYNPPSIVIRPTTYRPTTFTTTITESGKDNEINTGQQNNADEIKNLWGTTANRVPFGTYLDPISSRFSSASDGSANAISSNKVSAGGISSNAVFTGTLSAGGVSVGLPSTVPESANARPFEILSVNGKDNFSNDRIFQGIASGIDPRIYYFY